LASILFMTTASYGANENALGGMRNKAFRGAVNIFTGWIEFPFQIIKGYNNAYYEFDGNALMGCASGFFKGIYYSIGRTASGFCDVAGFWAADPEDNWETGIPLDAAYAWEKGFSYDHFDPSFGEATLRPIGKKLSRGLKNTFFGFAELPGQIAKGGGEGAFDFGIGKGIWFTLSREVSGIGDVVTFMFPNPEENLGYSFEEENAWDALMNAF